MPAYVKFLKDVISRKKRLGDYENISVPKSCNAVYQGHLSAKLKDPRNFSITCVIGNDRKTKALCDLGASISLMPLSFFRKLKFGTLKPTTITLQMVDGSIKHPNEIIEDVLVQVNDFIFPVDFVVLDMQETDTPLILGRPFLATSKALIDVAKGELTLHLDAKKGICSIYNATREPTDAKWFVQKKKAAHIVVSLKVKENELKPMNLSGLLKDGGKEPSVVEAKKELVKAKEIKKEDDPPMVKPKLTWWKKRLTKLYPAETKKDRDVNEVIRVRIN